MNILYVYTNFWILLMTLLRSSASSGRPYTDSAVFSLLLLFFS